ncbi:LuxR C-terminal-related transcriptional regulator [Actinokineospora enzanensis]|uniref:LuxR C-terminal-related transcriptional regulator n=1 Tax=Actinokineospora enzanensis TaxID=155975 RepID=UPI000380665E|nr:LuxR C-terminal-related transcriptional regulator [Actinokineospora enzanensis]
MSIEPPLDVAAALDILAGTDRCTALLPHFHGPLLRAVGRTLTRVTARGGHTDVIYPNEMYRHPPWLALARAQARTGTAVLVSGTPFPPLLIGPGIAVLTDRGASRPELFRDIGLTSTLDLFVRAVRGRAVELGGFDVHNGLAEREAELLALLGGGLTDAAAGKRMGYSARTVARVMADIMTRLDAASRFEAGVRAARLGWLPPGGAYRDVPKTGMPGRTRKGSSCTRV